MCLALGCARADRRPTDKVGYVLWRDRVEQLCRGRQAELDDVEEEAARDA